MTPIKLEFAGIHSFKAAQSIDFTRFSKGFFGIFGATGSGKSTILDAITLALYGKINRAKLTSDFINLSCEKATVRLTFSAVVNGADQTLIIERNFKRKKDKNTADSTAVCLIKQGDEFVVCAEGVFDCDAKIKEALGLGFDEFSKCIALPQGQFADFLRATPNERTGIISNIFDLFRFGTPVYESARKKEQSLAIKQAELSGKLTQMADISSEILDTLKLQSMALSSEFDEESNCLQSAQSEFDAIKQNYVKQNQLLAAKERAEKLKQDADAFDALDKKLKKAQAVRPLIEVSEQLDLDAKEISRLQQSFDETQAELKRVTAEFDQAKAEADVFLAGFNENYSVALRRINETQKAREDELELDDLSKKKRTLTLELDGLNLALDELNQTRDALTKNLNELNNKLTTQMGQKAEFEVDEKVAAQIKKGVDLGAQIEIIEKIANIVNGYLTQNRAELEKLREQAKLNEDELTALKSKREKSFDDLGQGGISFLNAAEKLKTAQEKNAQIVAVKDALETFDLLLASAQKTKNKYETELIDLHKKVSEQTRKAADLDEEQVSAKKYLQNCIKEYAAGASGKGVETSYESITRALDILSQTQNKNEDFVIDFNGLKSKIDAAEMSLNDINSQINLISSKRQAKMEQFVSPYGGDDFKTKLSKIQADLEQANAVLRVFEEYDAQIDDLIYKKCNFDGQIVKNEENIAVFEDLLSKIYALKAERKQIILGLERQFGGRDLFALSRAIDESKEKLKVITDQIAVTQESVNNITLELSGNKIKIGEQVSKIEALSALVSQTSEAIDKLGGSLEKVLAGASAQDAQAEAEFNLKKLEQTKALYEQKQSSLFIKRTGLESEVKLTSSKLREKLGAFNSKKAEFSATLGEYAIGDADELNGLRLTDQQMLEMKEAIENYQSARGLVRAEIENLEADLSGTVIDTSKMAALELSIESLKAAIDENRLAFGKIRGEIERVEKRLVEKLELSDLLKSVSSDLDYAHELVRVLRGKALAEFVCDEYLELITVRANQIAGLLLDGKFTLKFSDGEFYVEDNLNSGAQRAVSTLSGGETFLISLSLALSISEQITCASGKSMDFFFLDEGFGTLDSDLCDAVISALYKLESKNLKIGVISHIELLFDKIKNKIMVSKTEERGSELRLETTL